MVVARLSEARIRPARTKEDLDRAVEFLGTPRVRQIAEAHPQERGSVRICEHGGEILGVLLIDPSPLRIRSVPVRCARILETPGEDGRMLFRRTGQRELFEFMLEEFLGYLWGRRYPCAFVHGELALYPAFGFVPCYYHPRVYVGVDRALSLPKTYRVRHFKSEDAIGVLQMRQKNQNSKPIVFATGVPMFHHFSVIGPNRRVMGYFSLEANPKATFNPPFFAPEVEVQDRQAACTILRHGAEKAREMGLDEIHFPVGPGHPLASVCLELGGRCVVKGASSDPFLDEEMIFLSDPPGFIRALAPWFQARLKLGVDAAALVSVPLRTERGAWRLRIEGDGVVLAEMESVPPDCVELPHWKLTQLFVGYRGVGDLGFELLPDHEQTLRTLFPRAWPYSMSDPDLWEEVTPPLPYAKAAIPAVESVELPW